MPANYLSETAESSLITLDDDNTPITTSLIVAEKFGKEHYNVLKAIEALDCSEDFGAINFNGSNCQTKQGKTAPRHNMTRDGFVFLAMGFTGKKAAEFKVAFINEFKPITSLFVLFVDIILISAILRRFPARTKATKLTSPTT